MQNSVYQLTGQYDFRRMAGRLVLMPRGKYLLDQEKTVLMINEVTALILEQIQKKPKSEEDLLQILLTEYNVSKEEAEEALKSILEMLTEHQVLERGSSAERN